MNKWIGPGYELMFGIFKSKPVLSKQDFQFQIETFQWLLRNFGGESFYKDTELILPNKNFFPAKIKSQEEAASVTFETVKKYAGLEDWPCKLVVQEKDINPQVAPAIVMQNVPATPHGTFSLQNDNEIIISYNPAIVSDPIILVSTFAHELAHYLTATASDAPPGGWENWEFATDIAATFLGFGVFMANSSFNFKQYTGVDSQGWQFNRSGYLTEAEHCVALGLFLELKGLSASLVDVYLKSNLRKLLKSAIREIRACEIISELKKEQYIAPIQKEKD